MLNPCSTKENPTIKQNDKIRNLITTHYRLRKILLLYEKLLRLIQKSANSPLEKWRKI